MNKSNQLMNFNDVDIFINAQLGVGFRSYELSPSEFGEKMALEALVKIEDQVTIVQAENSQISRMQKTESRIEEYNPTK